MQKNKFTYFVYTFLGILLLPHIGHAQTSPLNLLPNSRIVENTEAFFSDFTRKKETLIKGEFESTAEYNKRVQKGFDTSKVFYFVAEGELTSAGKAQYSYDADKHKLTGIGGTFTFLNERDFGDYFRNHRKVGETTAPVIIHQVSQKVRTYTGENAFGVKRQIDEYYTTDCVLNILNANDIPKDIFDAGKTKFSLSFYTDPVAAKKLSGNLHILVGVTLEGYQRSKYECSSTHEPKIDEPYDSAEFVHLIDAKVRHILLVRSGPNPVLVEYKVTKLPTSPQKEGASKEPEKNGNQHIFGSPQNEIPKIETPENGTEL